jgi:hypothetical protein
LGLGTNQGLFVVYVWKGNDMKTFKLFLAASALTVAGLAASAPASAQPSSFSFRMGDVAIGYSDGYYDRDRRWHTWRNAREHRWYRTNYARGDWNRGERRAYYRSMRRDSDRDGIPNRFDRDRDNDGVPNRYDDRPNNPYRN